MKNELMIDIETTGQKPGCKVLTFGAFGFDKNGKQVQFYERFDYSKLGEAGLTDDQKTLEWWEGKDEDARDEAFEGKADPAESIAKFKMFFNANFDLGYGKGFRVWCCGLDFDFPILQEFFRRFGFAFPWKFWDQYDYRTVKNLFPIIKNAERNAAAHTALEDAKAQMRGLREFYQRAEGGSLT